MRGDTFLNPPRRQFALTALRVAGAMALCVVAGLAVGLVVALNAANRKMDRYAHSILAYSDGYSDEIVSTLDRVNASPFPFCSDQDIALLRELVFRGHLLKEIARVKDGFLHCTSINGRLANPLPETKPDLVMPSGRTVWLNVPLQTVPGMHADITGAGAAVFIAAPDAFGRLREAPMTYTTTLTNRPANKVIRTAGEPLTLSNAQVFAQKELLKGDTLYLSRCSARYAPCVVVGLTLRDAVQINSPLIAGFVIIGALAGVVLGLTILLQPSKRTLVAQLRRALRRNLLTIVYQPIVDAKTREIVSVEALARWTNEEGQIVPPDVFVTTAEKLGFIGDLTRVVLSGVVAEMGAYLRDHPDFQINVNIAAADLADPRFLPMLEKLLRKNRIASTSINLELTERSTANHRLAISAIGKLRERGHKFYIDDFGTGYSSLSYLHQLAIDAIKIDRAFTEAIGTGSLTAAIVPQIFAMARTLNIQVVIEGVERAEQSAYIASQDQSILAQGWYYGEPTPAAEILRRLAVKTPENISA